jgi:outer membrane receptor protein involved in Fe transport
MLGAAAWGQAAPPQPPAASTDATATPAGGLENLTVTARKKAESLQTVPLSVTDLTKKDLQNADVQTLHDVAKLTPGVNITDIGSEYATNIVIRGVSDQSYGTARPAASTFLDGVFLRDPPVINLSAVGLSRIEIVKGPVSALYGGDAYSGVINYVTERPTDAYHADLSQEFATHGRYQTNLSVSGAVIPGWVNVKLFGTYDTFGGFDHTPGTGTPGGDFEKKDIGALIDVHLSEHFTSQINLYNGNDHFGQSDQIAIPANCGFSASYGANTLYCGKVNAKGSQFQTNIDPGSGSTGNTRKVELASVKNILDYDWGKIEATTAVTKVTVNNYADFDLTPNGVPFQLSNGQTILEHSYYGGSSNTKNIAQELRYSSPQNQRFRYGAGAYIYWENRDKGTAAGLSEKGVPPGVTFTPALLATWATPNGEMGPNVNLSNQTYLEKSLFVSDEFDILPNLTISSQYRDSWLHQTFVVVKNQYSKVLYPQGAQRIDADNQYFNSNNAIRWQSTPNMMFYFAQANGTKPGGFNGASTVLADEAFGPETSMTFEGGAKTNWLGNKLQIDGAIYHIATRNTQAYGPSSDPNNGATVLRNFGSTSNLGFEVGVRVKPIANVTLGLGASYNHATFDSGTNDIADTGRCNLVPSCASKVVKVGGNTGFPIGGNSVPYSPDLTISASAQYDYTLLGKYDGYVRLDYSLKSGVYSDPSNLTSLGASSNVDLNAGISYQNYKLGAFIKNVTDDRTPSFYAYNVQLNHFQSVPTVFLPLGRTFGGQLSVHF